LKSLSKTYSRSRNHPATKIIEKYMDNCKIVHLDLYPLPGFVTKENIPVVNLSVIPAKLITDYQGADLYSMFLYAVSLSNYIKNEPFKNDLLQNISTMYTSIFIKLFGKASGLVGSYKNLIPKLKFIITLYTAVGIFGIPDTEKLRKNIAVGLSMDYSDLNLDFDFSSTVQFLNAINKNRIISISENKFSASISSRGGMSSLPMFEDISRFFATNLASTVTGNSIFSHYWSKINTSLFNRISQLGLYYLK